MLMQTPPLVITAGSTYLDIDAYACIVAMADLLQLQGKCAIPYSAAPCNYSVAESLIKEGQILRVLPDGVSEDEGAYIIVDVSDPDFLKDSVPLDRVAEIYDHHVGFEEYWRGRIGDGAHIEFIGAAATLIYRKWKATELTDRMTRETALLLMAAILDNTLNLTSSNTTDEDREVFRALCRQAGVDDGFRASYFSEVQEVVEKDLKNAIFGDIKTVHGNSVLPPKIAQICVWSSRSVIARLPEIREWFGEDSESFMINLIDLRENCSFFVCDDERYRREIERVFNVRFEAGVARSPRAYLRKQIMKKVLDSK